MNKYYNKKMVYYTIYKYNEFNNDIEYIREYTNTHDIKKDFKIKNINDYIIKSINKIKSKEDIKHLLNDKYLIFKETI